MRIPSKSFYKNHLQKYSQYSRSRQFIEWCSDIAPYRALRIIRLLKKYKKTDSRVIDVGCGIGLTISILAQKYPDTIGVDIDEQAVKGTKELLREVDLKTKVVKYDGKRLPLESNAFDIVTSLEVIEHALNPDLMLKEINRVLKKDGILVITTANKWWPYEPHFKLLLLSYLPPKIADLYVKLTGRGESYQDIKLPSYEEFRRMVEKYFTVEDVTLSLIRDYQDYALDKERGMKVVIVGSFLKWLDKVSKITVLNRMPVITSWLLTRLSLGWVFVARPKK